MKDLYLGQTLLVVCCVFYLIWWYLGFRPGVQVNRVGGKLGFLLLVTAGFGIAGLSFTMKGMMEPHPAPRLDALWIVLVGILSYIALVFVTKVLFSRVVTSELFLIVGWGTLEVCVVNVLEAAGVLTDSRLQIAWGVLAVALLLSLVLYVLYYRVEEKLAFYLAMVPLVTEGVSMVAIRLLCKG